MIDISGKAKTLRTARARAVIRFTPATIERIRKRDVPKGDPLETAKVACIQAVKQTSQLIPYCHPIPIEHVDVKFSFDGSTVVVEVTVTSIARTGVEMEALTGASIAALTLYDMVKMFDDSAEIAGVTLVSKTGGTSDFLDRSPMTIRAAILVLSDSIAAGKGEDVSGSIIAERLRKEGMEVAAVEVLPDEKEKIVEALLRYSDDVKCDCILTTGGTGFGPRDNTPEAMRAVIEKEVPGISESIRAHGRERSPFAIFSRGMSGMRGATIIVNLPGSVSGVNESLDLLLPALSHAVRIARGESGRH